MRSYPTVTACVHHGGTPYFSLTRFAISGWGISEALLPSSKCTHSSHVCPVLSAILASAIPATFAYASGGGAGMLLRRGAEGPGAGDARLRCGLLGIWARAGVYDSRVFSMRARTTRLRSLLLVIVRSPLGAPRPTPQQRVVVNAKDDDTASGSLPPFASDETPAGAEYGRFGADRRRQHHCAGGRRRQERRARAASRAR